MSLLQVYSVVEAGMMMRAVVALGYLFDIKLLYSNSEIKKNIYSLPSAGEEILKV